MRKLLSVVVLALTMPAGWAVESSDSGTPTDQPVRYSRDIAPILQQKCVACHRDKQSEGGLSLETTDGLMRGGDSGASIVAGNLDESVLFARVSGAEEPIMPPEDNAVGAKPLTEKELDQLRRWILDGAKLDAAEQTAPLQVQPIPESIHDSFALAASPDGSVVAVGRANRVELLDAASGRRIGLLVDEAIDQDGVADIDFIQALAFSPLGDRLATGGFRTVRIWKRVVETVELPSGFRGAAGLLAISPDGKQFASVNAIGDLEIWDRDSQQLSATVPRTGQAVALAWHCPSKVVVADDGGTLRVVDSGNGRVIERLPTEVAISEVVQTPDGRYTAAVGGDGRVVLFDESTPLSLDAVSKVTDATAIASVAPTMLAVGTAAGKVLVIDLAAKSLRHTFDHGAAVHALAVGDDAATLASGGSGGDVKWWNLADGKSLATFVGDPNTNLRLAALDRDIRRESGWLDRLNAQTAKLQERLKKEEEALGKVVEAKNSAVEEVQAKKSELDGVMAKVATSKQAIEQKTKRVQQARETLKASEAEIASSNQAVETMSKRLQPLEQQAAAADEDVKAAEARVAEAMKQLQLAQARAREIAGQVSSQQEAMEKQKARNADAVKAKADADQTIKQVTAEIESEKQSLAKLNDSAGSVQEALGKATAELGQREQALATAKKTRDVAAAKLPAHQETIRRRGNRLAGATTTRQRVTARRDQGEPVVRLVFSPDRRSLAAIRSSGSTVIYDTASGRASLQLKPRPTASQAGVAGAAFIAPNRLLVQFREGQPVVFSTETQWTLEQTIGGWDSDLLADRVTAVDFSHDGRSLAIGSGVPSRSGQVLIVDPTDGRVLRRYEELHSDTLLCLRFAPDDRSLATSASDKTIRVIDLQGNQVVGALDGHTHHVLSFDWNDAGTMIASASADGTIKTWDAVTGQRQRTMVNIAEEVTAIEFVPDSAQVVSAAADGGVRLHDAGNGKQVAAANVPGDPLFAIELSPDGSKVYASGQSGKVHVFSLEGLKKEATWEASPGGGS